jgi:hypothetical protein
MITTSTQTTDSLPQQTVYINEKAEELGDDELAFYSSIKKDLNKLEINPGISSIEKILKYSRSL